MGPCTSRSSFFSLPILGSISSEFFFSPHSFYLPFVACPYEIICLLYVYSITVLYLCTNPIISSLFTISLRNYSISVNRNVFFVHSRILQTSHLCDFYHEPIIFVLMIPHLCRKCCIVLTCYHMTDSVHTEISLISSTFTPDSAANLMIMQTRPFIKKQASPRCVIFESRLA